MIKDLVKHEIQYRISIPSTSEATFSEKFIMPALRRVLLQDTTDDLIYRVLVSQIYLFTSTLTLIYFILLTRIDKNDHNGKKPDFMIGSKLKKRSFAFFSSR
jgi:patatin-like phospholipase/acyl hydrolase